MAARQAKLKKHYRFSCCCERCCSERGAGADGDDRASSKRESLSYAGAQGQRGGQAPKQRTKKEQRARREARCRQLQDKEQKQQLRRLQPQSSTEPPDDDVIDMADL